ncbi:MAG: single-stranded-DNA-specific exonuclease RecJ [Hyphomicrobium sp. 32-62-53]|nr:MAG: single-stranded-DNA-specific exonuclease RecJ [Hyphomicrobium sp. 12-62-95]OYX99657.1 MAG: single-stranded-DNA-specific exonuclease RecJ [Hyphomicrobium sp. 32-62-53]
MGAVRKRRAAAMDEPAAFLGVAQSARGYVWRERLMPEAQNTALAISQQHGLPELLGRVLAARGVGLGDVPVYLDPSVKALMPDPASLAGMERVAARIADAIERREPVAIFGDYDVDGACSSALLSRFLSAHETPSRIYIPDRIFEGYGPNIAALETLVKEGAKLIVTVDCGTTSFETMAAAKKLATDILVIDHHQADETLPDVLGLVNPNRQDDVSGQGHLCAAGVVFLVLVAVMRVLRQRGHYAKGAVAPDLLGDLDLVALATVADVVPLTGLNRAYVRKGLAVMKSRENVGLRALFDAAGLNQAPTTYHLGYILGPRINAGGRIGDAALGARLLTTHDEVEAQKIAVLLDKLNKERKVIETQMLEEAFADADRRVTDNPDLPIVVVGSETWHKGVVGLVASRLVERFGRPSCVIAWEKQAGSGAQTGTGSLRSVAGVDIGAAVRGAVAAGLLQKGGGHAMAAGLTVARDKIGAVESYFGAELADASSAARARVGLDLDGALVASGVTDGLMDLIERAGPFGQGNAQPRFAFPSVRVKFAKAVGEAHLRCVLEAADGSRLEGVAFRAIGQPLGDLLQNTGGMPIHVAGALKRDTWGGREKIELTIEDAADPRRQD